MPPRTSSRGRVAATARSKAAALVTRRRPVLDPIITMNAGGIIQSASASVEDVFGWTPTELFGRNVKLLIPESEGSELDRYLDRYRNSERAKTLDTTLLFDAVRNDGRLIQIELSLSRADLPLPAAPFFVGIIRDVSRVIEIEPDSPGVRLRLQQLVTEQTRALATANLRLLLSDRLASLGTLAAGLGHDMNSVLLPVRARLNALEHAGITSAALTHVTAIRQSITYLQQLSDGLHFLTLDPDASGVADNGNATTDLAVWWEQVGPLLSKAVPKHVKLEASLPQDLPRVNIAPHWLTQAVLNLIVNAGEAIPATRRGGLVRVWAIKSDTGRTIKLGVTDNGRGMPPDVLRRAFDLFYTTRPRSLGTGLGLPLARKVAARAGGTLDLTSEPGKGTSAVLVLPFVASNHGDSLGERSEHRSAALSVKDTRTAALLTQILITVGIEINPGQRAPGKVDLWVTKPTADALREAARWHKVQEDRVAIVLGAPPQSSRRAWAAIRAIVVDPPGNFEAIRHAVGEAIGRWNSNTRSTKP